MANQELEEERIDYFDKLPEGCIADTISYTTPTDACKLALVSPSFRSIADSDAVWDRFLPSDYAQLVSRSAYHHLLPLTPKKNLYLSLSDHPLIIDAGALSFSLNKLTGKKCFMIAAKELAIVWGDTPRYWRWNSCPESRFGKAIELIEVCWFEIHGRLSTALLSPDTAYTTYLVYKPSTKIYGFEFQPVDISVGIIGEESNKCSVFVDLNGEMQRENGGVRQGNVRIPRRTERENGGVRQGNVRIPRRTGLYRTLRANNQRRPRDGDHRYPKTRKDGWLEIELGEYFNKEGEDRELEITLMEVKGGNWKSGLIIEGFEIRPKGLCK